MLIAFWFFAVLIFYTLIGFPVAIFLLSRIFSKPVRRDSDGSGELPTVSLIVAAYNEEKVIEARIENALSLNYPRDKLEVLVVSDGSTDQTPLRVEAFAGRGVRSLYNPVRRGKTAALNRTVPASNGEILLFADANTTYNTDAVLNMIRNFTDPAVGAVSGRKLIVKEEGRFASEGETSYWQYESFVKSCESQIGSIATADGEIFAIRRSLFSPLPEDIIHDDMALTLDVIQKGYRVVYEPAAVSSELASKNAQDEYQIKIRLAAGGYQILYRFHALFFPPRNLFAVMFLSHKFLRWAMPLWLIGLFLSNLFLPQTYYRVTLWGQVLFYAVGTAGVFFHKQKGGRKIFYFPNYFCMANLAAFVGLIRFATGTQGAAWRKAER